MKNKYTLLTLILLVHIASWLLLKPVWPFSDDYCYSLKAHEFLNGDFNLTYSQFQNRFGVYVPASIIFYFFGIDPYTVALWPLLASCFTIVVVFLFLDKITNTTVAFFASFLIEMNIMQITYSIALFPDLIVSLYCIASILLLYYGRQYENTSIRYPLLLNLVLLIGFLTKETILMISPFFILVLVYDLYQKQNILFWKRTIAFGIGSILLQFLMYYSITGDAFFRIRSLFEFNNGLLDEKTANNIKAMFSSNIFKWLNGELGYVLILIVTVYSFCSLRKKSITDFHSYITIYSLLLLFEFIFLFHTEKYGVVFMQSRLWILIIAPMAIVMANLIYSAENKFYIFLILVFTAMGLYNYFAVSFHRALLYGLFLVTAVFSYFLKQKNKQWNLLLLPFPILAGYFIYSNSNYRVGSLGSSNLIKEQLEQLDSSNKIILCEHAFAENHIIFNEFNEYSHLKFYPYSKSDSLLGYSSVYVIVNQEDTNVPEFILQDQKKWNLCIDKKSLLIYKKIE